VLIRWKDEAIAVGQPDYLSSREAVTVEATHPKGGTLSVTWDVAQAKRAGLLSNQVWAKHPRAMLKARAITEAVRALYPACLTGALTAEEVIEITAPAPPYRQRSRPSQRNRCPKRTFPKPEKLAKPTSPPPNK